MSDDGAYRAVRSLQSDIERLDRRLAGLESHMKDLGPQVSRGIREGLKEGLEIVGDRFREVSETLGEIELAKEGAEVTALPALLDRQLTQLQERVQGAQAQVIEIQERYDRKQTEIVESYKKDIRRLGRHAFEVLDSDFKKSIVQRLAPADLVLLSESNQGINDERNELVAQHLPEARRKLDQIKNGRARFRKQIESALVNEATNEAYDVHLAYWVAVTDDGNGDQGVEVVIPSNLNGPSAGEPGVPLTPRPVLREYVDRIKQISRKTQRGLPWRPARPDEVTAEADRAEEVLSRYNLDKELAREVVKILRESPAERLNEDGS